MKKLLFLIIIIMLGGCVKSDYSVKFIDTSNPQDTLSYDFIGKDRCGWSGKDTHVLVTTYNAGTMEYPIYLHSLRYKDQINSHNIFICDNPIEIIRFEYLGKHNKKQ